MKIKNRLTRRKPVMLLVIIVVAVAFASGLVFMASRIEGSDKETSAARMVADQYLAYVQTCNLDKAKPLRRYGISDKDEVAMLCAQGCKPFNFTYDKIYEKMKTEVAPGDPEQKSIKSVTFEYQLTCGSEHKPYMMGMEYNSEEQKWQVFLDASIGNPEAL